MSQKTYDHLHTKEQLWDMILKMKVVYSEFYTGAQRTGNHAFIEFCGLMKDYVDICQKTLEQGGDFTVCNTHTGHALVARDYQIDYLYEKLDCIYGPTIAAQLKAKLLAGVDSDQKVAKEEHAK